MKFVYEVVVLVHLLGMASLVGGFLATVKKPRVNNAMWHGALTQVVTGLILVAGLEMHWTDGTPNHMKIGIKLAIAIGALVFVWLARRTTEETKNAYYTRVAGLLAIVNVVVAVLV